jgi:hypothetical protein
LLNNHLPLRCGEDYFAQRIAATKLAKHGQAALGRTLHLIMGDAVKIDDTRQSDVQLIELCGELSQRIGVRPIWIVEVRIIGQEDLAGWAALAWINHELLSALR